jgi:hypothetical protein
VCGAAKKRGQASARTPARERCLTLPSSSHHPSIHSTHTQRFSVLGSTGSIGTQTLDIAAEHGDKFEIVALSAGGNIDLLAEQVSFVL